MTDKLFYIAQYFTPEPYLKDIDFIKELKDKGWDPVVITGFPNYPKGKIYPGYKNRLFSEETLEGVKIIRVFTYADHSLSSFKRTLNYFIFAFFAAIAVIKYGKRESFYYTLQSSPFVVLCAWSVKLFKPKSKILLDIQDIFPENIRVSGFIKSRWIIDIIDYILNRFYYSAFDLFVTVSESFRTMLSNKKISSDRILTLYNWSMVEKKSNKSSRKYRFDTQGFNIVYAGNIGVHQGLSKLVDGMNAITAKNSDIYFHFFGDGTDFEALKNKSAENKNIVLHGRVASSEISDFLEAADALFLHLIKDPIYECIIPSKLQAYIEVGKPILAGIEGEARLFVTDQDLGEVFQSENNTEFQSAALKLAAISVDKVREIRERSINLYSQKFSRSAGAEKVHQFITKNF